MAAMDDKNNNKVSPLVFQFDKFENIKRWRIHQLKSGEIYVYCDFHNQNLVDINETLISHIKHVVPGQKFKIIYDESELPIQIKFKRTSSEFIL